MYPTLSDNVSATRAIAVQFQAMTNNVANMNTDGFGASDVTFSPGPGGEGLSAHVSPTKAPAPVILRDGELRLGSNTDLTRETVTRATASAAFKANLGIMASQDSLAEAALSIVA